MMSIFEQDFYYPTAFEKPLHSPLSKQELVKPCISEVTTLSGWRNLLIPSSDCDPLFCFSISVFPFWLFKSCLYCVNLQSLENS